MKDLTTVVLLMLAQDSGGFQMVSLLKLAKITEVNDKEDLGDIFFVLTTYIITQGRSTIRITARWIIDDVDARTFH